MISYQKEDKSFFKFIKIYENLENSQQHGQSITAIIHLLNEFSHENGNWNDEYYKEGIYVRYRYFDKFNITPRYCFGYGLVYSTFSIENTNVEANHENITAKATVKNTGSRYSGR